MRIKLSILFLLVTSVIFSQNDSLLKKKYSFSYSKYNVYAFYDVVRFAGVGVEYRPNAFLGIDLKVGCIYAHSVVGNNIYANDYFYMHGAGFMLTPKSYISNKRRFYVGLNLAFYDYGYKKTWAQNGVDYAFNIDGIHELRDRKTYSYAIGPTIGFNQSIGKIDLELFIGLGAEITSNKIIVYDRSGYGTPPPSFPYTYAQGYTQINAFGGIKMGFGLKKQSLYAKKYYTKTLHKRIANCDKIVLKNYIAKNITETKLREYYTIRNEQFDNLKKIYFLMPKDTSSLKKAIDLGYKNITTYVNYVYGKH